MPLHYLNLRRQLWLNRRGSSFGVAFTLVELLVVIGIIALLISILLPALSKARATSRQVACMSNLRQIGVAIRMYANDNRDHYPATDAVGGYWGYRRALGVRDVLVAYPEWMGLPALLNGVRFDDFSLSYSIPQVIAGVNTALTHPRYLSGQSKVWTCPAYPEQFAKYGNTYQYNILQTFPPYYMPDSPTVAKRIGDLVSNERGNPAFRNYFVCYDNVGFLPYQAGAIAPPGVSGSAYTTSQVRPHPKRNSMGDSYNCLMFDGRVEIFPQ